MRAAVWFVPACAILAGCSAASETGGGIETVQAIPAPATAGPPPPQPASPPSLPGPASFVVDGAIEQGGWIRGQVPGGTERARLGQQSLMFDRQGRFFAAFDRDAGPTAELVAELRGGKRIVTPLAVKPREWQEERVDLARNISNPSAAFLARRGPELAAIEDARTADAPSEGWRQEFVWPVTGRISGRFGSQRIYRGGERGSYHSGIDIAPGAGVPFVAPADGVVTLAAYDPFSLEGHLVIVDHGAGLNSAFLHASRIFVRVGQTVRQGERIGLVGASGSATGPHLHWSMKWHDARLDPLLFTGPMH